MFKRKKERMVKNLFEVENECDDIEGKVFYRDFKLVSNFIFLGSGLDKVLVLKVLYDWLIRRRRRRIKRGWVSEWVIYIYCMWVRLLMLGDKELFKKFWLRFFYILD